MKTGKATNAEMRGRLDEAPAPVILAYIYEPRLEKEAASLPYLTEANLAHVVMLARTGILEASDANALLGVLMQIDQHGLDLFQLDPELEGLYYNYERYVIRSLAPGVGGRLHTGRSRNDLSATLSRMRVRDLILDMLDRVLAFRGALLRVAAEHTETVITGYTHLQPAQPITMGHYLLAFEQALQRDATRLLHTYHNTNHACLGAGALAGTGFPIDRQLPAELLGFDGLIENTLDAVAGRDYLLQFLSDLSILAVTLSRLAQDLYVWYTYEFGLIGLPDAFGGTSSIMPQKKNPVLLETCRGGLSQVLAGLTSALSAMKNTNYTNLMDANTEAFHLLDDSTHHAMASLALLQAAIENMEVRGERAYAMACANFSTVTELADTLVREENYSFREAHHIVGLVVRKALEQGLAATAISSAFIDEVVVAETGDPVGLAEEKVRQALEPRRNVEARAHEGGPAPAAVARSIEKATALLHNDAQRVDETRQSLAGARESLREIVQEMIEGRT